MSDHENKFWNEAQRLGLESRLKDYKSRLAAASAALSAERDKVRVLRELLCLIYNSQAVTNKRAIDLERWAGDTLCALATTEEDAK